MKICVIGGGFTGLAAAITLAQQGKDVTLLEQGNNLGGLAGAFPVDNFYLDYNYRHIFKQDTEALAWINKYNLSVNWYNSHMGYYTNNKIFSFGKPHDLLFFSPLSWLARFRFALGTLRIKNENNFLPLEQETAEHYLVRHSGLEVFNIIWKPLLLAKFGSDYQKISAVWIWGKIALRGKTRDSSGMQEQLGYMPGSFQILINSMAQDIEKLGGKIHTNTQVLHIQQQSPEKFKLAIIAPNKTLHEEYFDAVISALPLPEFINIAEPITEIEKNTWKSIKFTGASTLILILQKQFSNMYWLNIGNRNIPFGGLIEHTNLVPKSWYNNKHILYISHYMFTSSEFFGLSPTQLLNLYMPHLQAINPSFSPSDVLGVYGGQGKYAQPVIETNYSKVRPTYFTSVKNLIHVGMAHIYPEDRGINYALKTGKEAALTLLTP